MSEAEPEEDGEMGATNTMRPTQSSDASTPSDGQRQQIPQVCEIPQPQATTPLTEQTSNSPLPTQHQTDGDDARNSTLVSNHADNWSDESAQSDIDLTRTSYVGLTSNCLLLLGYISNVVFSYYDKEGRAREPFAIFIYFLAFGILVISALTELGLDVFFTRVVRHGRYCDSNFWNIVISLLFVLAGLFDIVAFIFWEDMQMETEKNLLFVSAYALLVMIVIVMRFTVLENRRGIKDMLNLVANVVVGVGVILNLLVRHFQKANVQEDVSKNMEFWLSIVWLLSALIYVWADLIVFMKCHST